MRKFKATATPASIIPPPVLKRWRKITKLTPPPDPCPADPSPPKGHINRLPSSHLYSKPRDVQDKKSKSWCGLAAGCVYFWMGGWVCHHPPSPPPPIPPFFVIGGGPSPRFLTVTYQVLTTTSYHRTHLSPRILRYPPFLGTNRLKSAFHAPFRRGHLTYS